VYQKGGARKEARLEKALEAVEGGQSKGEKTNACLVERSQNQRGYLETEIGARSMTRQGGRGTKTALIEKGSPCLRERPDENGERRLKRGGGYGPLEEPQTEA